MSTIHRNDGTDPGLPPEKPHNAFSIPVRARTEKIAVVSKTAEEIVLGQSGKTGHVVGKAIGALVERGITPRIFIGDVADAVVKVVAGAIEGKGREFACHIPRLSFTAQLLPIVERDGGIQAIIVTAIIDFDVVATARYVI